MGPYCRRTTIKRRGSGVEGSRCGPRRSAAMMRDMTGVSVLPEPPLAMLPGSGEERG
jgi:hypothetical protein